jgi:hypothetical protein
MDGGDLSTSQAAKEALGKKNGGEISCKPKARVIECVQIPSDGQKGSPISSGAIAEEAGEEVSFEFSVLNQPVAVYLRINRTQKHINLNF